MPFVKVLDAAQLPSGALRPITVEGRSIAVCHSTVDGKIYAVSGECPHSGGPLGQGALHGHSIVCPWHAWEFDCRSGTCDFNQSNLETFPVKIADGSIWINFE